MSAAVGVHAFLADAVTRADGKLYAHGAGWNVLGVARLPAVHGHLGLGLIFSVPAAAAAHPHSFEVRLENADLEGAGCAILEADHLVVDGALRCF